MKYMITIAALSFLLPSCGGSEKNEAQTEAAADSTADPGLVVLTDAQLKNAGIVVGKIEQKPISTVLGVNGRVDVPPQNLVSVSMPIGGYIRSAGLLPGTPVRKGQILATLEDQQYIELQQEFLNARTKLSLAEREYQRQLVLKQGGAASEKVFQQAEADYSSQQVMVKSLGEKLRLIGLNPDRLSAAGITRSVHLYAPINGYVSRVFVNPGRYVNPSDVLFELVNPEDIHLALTIFEKDLPKIFIGQRVISHTVSSPDVKYQARVILIGQSLDSTRSAEVHCHFVNYDKRLVPGTFMNARVEIGAKAAPAVPSGAIVRYQDKHYLFLQEGGNRFRMQEIIAGNEENGFTEVRGDMSALQGKSVVVKGAYSLLMKAKNVEEEE